MAITLPTTDPIKHLVYKKYPQTVPLARLANGMSESEPANSLIDPIPALETHDWPKLPEDAESYREKLAAMPQEELDRLYQEELQKQWEEEDKARFFNKPSAKADFDYWSKMSEWSMEEAVVLSFGKNPEVVTWPRIEKVLPHTSPFVQKCLKLKELATRAKKAKHFIDAVISMPADPILPHKFVNWMQANKLDFPQELAEKVLETYEKNKPPKTALEESLERLEKVSNDHGTLTQKAEELLRNRKSKIQGSPNPVSQTQYIPSYLQLMLQAVQALNLSADKRANMDDIVKWLNQNWPPHLEGKSDRIIQSMATLLRRPQDKRGGNTRWNKE